MKPEAMVFGNPRFTVIGVEYSLSEREKPYYSVVRCARCHAELACEEALVARVVTVTSGSELTVFIHRACLSEMSLAGEVRG